MAVGTFTFRFAHDLVSSCVLIYAMFKTAFSLVFSRVIWLGDLNYRLALSPSVTRSLLAREDWDALLEKDQV